MGQVRLKGGDSQAQALPAASPRDADGGIDYPVRWRDGAPAIRHYIYAGEHCELADACDSHATGRGGLRVHSVYDSDVALAPDATVTIAHALLYAPRVGTLIFEPQPAQRGAPAAVRSANRTLSPALPGSGRMTGSTPEHWPSRSSSPSRTASPRARFIAGTFLRPGCAASHGSGSSCSSATSARSRRTRPRQPTKVM